YLNSKIPKKHPNIEKIINLLKKEEKRRKKKKKRIKILIDNLKSGKLSKNKQEKEIKKIVLNFYYYFDFEFYENLEKKIGYINFVILNKINLSFFFIFFNFICVNFSENSTHNFLKTRLCRVFGQQFLILTLMRPSKNLSTIGAPELGNYLRTESFDFEVFKTGHLKE
ncbi:hypothetical protein DMUE_4757, partial [Dictyocoela muelleri]